MVKAMELGTDWLAFKKVTESEAEISLLGGHNMSGQSVKSGTERARITGRMPATPERPILSMAAGGGAATNVVPGSMVESSIVIVSPSTS